MSTLDVALPTHSWTTHAILAWARGTLCLPETEIAGALGVTAPTIRRWERGASAPRGQYRTQIVALQDLRALLEAVFASPAHAMTWLRNAPGISDGVPPLDMIKVGAITPLVGVLASLESGAFS